MILDAFTNISIFRKRTWLSRDGFFDGGDVPKKESQHSDSDNYLIGYDDTHKSIRVHNLTFFGGGDVEENVDFQNTKLGSKDYKAICQNLNNYYEIYEESRNLLEGR